MMYDKTLFSMNENIIYELKWTKEEQNMFLRFFLRQTRLSVFNVKLKSSFKPHSFLNVKLHLIFSIQQHNKHLSITETGNCAGKVSGTWQIASCTVNWVFWTQSPTSKTGHGTRPLLQKPLSRHNSYSWY